VPPTGGAGGAGVTGGSGGTPSCGPIDGPLSIPSARSVIPFSLTVGGAGGEGGHAALDDDELAMSGSGGVDSDGGCEPIADGFECIGTAITTKRGVALSFEFEDGSMLEWTAVATTYVAPPQVTHGDLVFIEYEHRTPLPTFCPTCGNTTLTSIRLWSAGREQVLWFGREGSSIPEVDPGYVTSLFQIPYRLSRSCVMEPFRVDCYTAVTRVLYDHVLETTPEQWIPHATLTRVATPGGTYDVVWASSEQTVVRDANCDDGRFPAQDRGFAASRLDPAPW
jgi:hypothetical protein